MKIDLDMDINKVSSRVERRLDKVQADLDQQILTDSNFYCPEQEGFLQASGITGSKIGSGELIWNSPYAAAQYYDNPNKSKDANPNASMKWFERAKSTRKKAWEALANRRYKAA